MEKEDLLEGRNHVYEALKAGREINKILVSKGLNDKVIGRILAKARERKIVVQIVDRRKLDDISETGFHQGIIALAAPKPYVEIEEIIAKAKEKGDKPFILILDEVEDEYNLGSLIRTAVATGVHGVVISKRRAAAVSSRVGKASAGALEYMDIARVTNINQTIKKIQEENIWVYGLEAESEKSIYDTNFSGGIAIVLGSEGTGISRLTKENCDEVIKIPMEKTITSISVSTAGAITLFEVYKNRLLHKGE